MRRKASESFLTLVEGLPERYVVHRPVGETPTCLLFLAEDLETGELLSLSVVRPALVELTGTERLEQALEEGGCLDHSRLESPVQVGVAGDLFFYVTPYRRGWTVRDKLAAHGGAPPGQAARIMRDVASALAHAHQEGTAHLLLAPEQLLLTDEGALVRGLGLGGALMESGALSGGLPLWLVSDYTAPELREELTQSAAMSADLYGLGALGYDLVVGHPPSVSALSKNALGDAIVRHIDPATTEDRDSVAASLADLILSCLATDPVERPEGIEEALGGLEAMLTRLAAGTHDGEPPDRPDSIGAYRILERLGEGGMGTVYRAARDDGPGRPVALKIIRQGMDTREVVRRFKRESEALSLLDHENVARIFHASISEGGRPYFVMEVVEGLPITEYADAHRLSIPARVALLEQVCRGVQHAHQKGVIHRDLKPSNVLVPTAGSSRGPKVIDFGLAKVMRDPSEPEGSATRGGQALGTPEYMSPEQAVGAMGDVDTRSDIYSLGVIAFELLTGMLPEVGAGVPPAPSVVVGRHPEGGHPAGRRGLDARSLRRALRGDLDAIVRHCLEPDRARRYPTAQALADDLRGYRESQPISAQTPSSLYRARKFVQRHRLGVAAASAFSLALVVALAVTTVLWTRARDAEALAAEQAQAADEALAFMTGLFAEANPLTRVGEVSAREILDRGREQIREVDMPPLVRARLVTSMGGAYLGLGMESQAEEALREAIALWRSTAPSQGGDEEQRLMVNLAGVVMNMGRMAEADSLLVLAIPMFRSRPPVDSHSLGRGIWVWGNVRNRMGDFDSGDSLLAEAGAILEAALGAEHPDVAGVNIDRAKILLSMGSVAGAEELARRAVDALEAGQPPPLRLTATARSLLGRTLAARGAYAEAEAYATTALETMEAELGVAHGITQEFVFGLAQVLRLGGKPEEAVPLFRRVVSHIETEYGPEHPNVTIGLSNLGSAYTEAGRLAEAGLVLERALGLARERWGESSMRTQLVVFELAKLELARGNLRAAVPQLEESMAFRRANFGEGDLALGDVALPLSRGYLRQGRAAEAEPLAREALQIFESHLPPTHRWVADAREHLEEVTQALSSPPA